MLTFGLIRRWFISQQIKYITVSDTAYTPRDDFDRYFTVCSWRNIFDVHKDVIDIIGKYKDTITDDGSLYYFSGAPVRELYEYLVSRSLVTAEDEGYKQFEYRYEDAHPWFYEALNLENAASLHKIMEYMLRCEKGEDLFWRYRPNGTPVCELPKDELFAHIPNNADAEHFARHSAEYEFRFSLLYG